MRTDVCRFLISASVVQKIDPFLLSADVLEIFEFLLVLLVLRILRLVPLLLRRRICHMPLDFLHRLIGPDILVGVTDVCEQILVLGGLVLQLDLEFIEPGTAFGLKRFRSFGLLYLLLITGLFLSSVELEV